MNIALVVVIDADRMDFMERKNSLESSAEFLASGQPGRQPEEKVAFFVPQRNIETWFKFLNGQEVSLQKDYKKQIGPDETPAKSARRLVDICQNQAPANALNSLKDAASKCLMLRI